MGREINTPLRQATIDELIIELYRWATDDDWQGVRPRTLGKLARLLGLTGAAWWLRGRRGGDGDLIQLAGTGATVEELRAFLPEDESMPTARVITGAQTSVLVHYPHRNGVLLSAILLQFPRSTQLSDIGDLQRLCVHAAEAADVALGFHIRRDDWLHSMGRPSRGSGALVDSNGTIYVASERFAKLLDAEGEPMEVLPFRLPADVLDGTESTFIQAPLHYRVSRVGSLFMLYARKPLPLDQLSPREQEIARALGNGKTFKSVAREYGIAVSTVANHASRIYRKLAIYRREELIALLRTPSAPGPGMEVRRH
jgi:DNA-binding CsgD family transcriptional regulator